MIEYIERGSSMLALLLEHYPDDPQSIAANKKGIFLKPKLNFHSIEEVEAWNYR